MRVYLTYPYLSLGSTGAPPAGHRGIARRSPLLHRGCQELSPGFLSDLPELCRENLSFFRNTAGTDRHTGWYTYMSDRRIVSVLTHSQALRIRSDRGIRSCQLGWRRRLARIWPDPADPRPIAPALRSARPRARPGIPMSSRARSGLISVGIEGPQFSLDQHPPGAVFIWPRRVTSRHRTIFISIDQTTAVG